jgi:HAD superfamily hydrolase (TIGR01549 family)
MALELAGFCALHPLRWREALIVAKFRKLREKHYEREEESLEVAQYRWAAEALHLSPERVRSAVDEWLLRRPLKHLRACRPSGLSELFERLRKRGIKIGIFSDYPAQAKLERLELKADLVACAIDRQINRLKPHTAGFAFIAGQFGASPSECLHVGDREDRDGACASRFGCGSVILPAHLAKALGKEKTYDLICPG